MFRRWRPTADDASPWEQGSWSRSAESASAPTCWPTRWVDDEEPPAPAPSIVIREPQPAAAEDLGFPAFATKNTTRVAGADPAADAAGVALAVFPSTGGVKRPAAVSLVADDDWPAGLAAASLVAQPIRAPILVSGSDEIPDFTEDALAALAPTGSAKTDGKQIFTIGSATAPGDFPRKRSAGPIPQRPQRRSTGFATS